MAAMSEPPTNGPTARSDQYPSPLTTQQTFREVAMLREIIEARLDGMDKAIDLAAKYPTIIDAANQQLTKLFEEKFKGIATQFAERDIRVEQTARDSKTAVDAALQAAKEAVGKQNDANTLSTSKSEAGFTKQIDQIAALLATEIRGIVNSIEDVKTRLSTVEADVKTRITSIEGQSKGAGNLWGIILGGIAALGTVISIFVLIQARSGGA